MTPRTFSPLTPALAVMVAQWLSSVAIAQDFPPAPPLSVRIAQVQILATEPTPIGPALPGLAAPVPVLAPALAPHPDDLPPADASMAVPEADVEAFARGPVHEAFADVYDLNPVTGEIVAVAPPAAVDELPPEQAPQGENVQWISGYWGWDSEAKDYLWVSGVWRDVPPGRRWVPGYWAEVAGGFQWVGGFWNNAQSPDLTYVPVPPQSLEVGPNVPPPGDDQLWVPGNWNYVSNDYRWSPGYYTPCQEEYMWIPNQYNWTPRGCVYVPGYWDYRFARRGTLFSPVRFRRSLADYGYGRPACYQPRYSVNMSSFLIHLFVRPRNRNFYYGDYYGNQYAGLGFTPWYRRTSLNHRCYDPAFNFYRADSHRHGVDFGRSVDNWHRRYESNVDIRPPRLIHDQAEFQVRHRGDRAAELAVMTNRFDDVVKHPTTSAAFHKMDRQEINLQRENNRVNHQLETARRQTERDVRIVRAGDLQPGESVELPIKETRDRAARLGNRGAVREGAEDVQATTDRLVLTDLPEKLQEKTRDSAATVERISQRTGQRAAGQPAMENPGETAREKAIDRAGERVQIREQATTDRAARMRTNDNEGVSPADAVRQRIDERRVTREADQQSRRAAPTPDAVPDRQPRVFDRTPQNDLGAVQERVVRERQILNRNDNPDPIFRQNQAEQAPPIDRASRSIERQVPMERQQPVERHQPVERAPRQERHAPAEQQAPRRKGRD